MLKVILNERFSQARKHECKVSLVDTFVEDFSSGV